MKGNDDYIPTLRPEQVDRVLGSRRIYVDHVSPRVTSLAIYDAYPSCDVKTGRRKRVQGSKRLRFV